MSRSILILIFISIIFYSIQTSIECHDIQKAHSSQVWQVIKMSRFDRLFILTAGSLSILILILAALSWIIFRSFQTPSDIMFAITLSQLIQNSTFLFQAGYFTSTDNSNQKPVNFDQACFVMGIMNVLGNVLSIYYNLIFCVILAYSIQRTLKGFLFNRFRYHLISFVLTGLIILVLSLTQGLGRSLNGVCGWRVASNQSTARFIIELIICAICIYCMISFKGKLPKNQFFNNQSLFGFYFIYMGIFSVTQIISNISSLANDIMCKINTSNIISKLHIFYSISMISSILLSYFLVFMRFQHPLLLKKIKIILWSKKLKENQTQQSKIQTMFQPNHQNDDQIQSWLGCLLESLKGSQILSFLEGTTIAFIQRQRKCRKQQLSVLSFIKNYTFNINQLIVQSYLERRLSSRESFLIQKKLGGLYGLDYSVTSYCPQVFSQICTLNEISQIIRSLDIKKNIKIVKKQSCMNGGKSGQLFFGTFDHHLIFKSVSQDEALIYINKIKHFTDYFQKERNSLIVKILGVFRFTRNDIKDQSIYLILMYNITLLPQNLNIRVYDIKGSEYNRSTIQEMSLKEQKYRQYTLKDKDFTKLEKKINIDQSDAQSIKKILKNDIKFLSSLGFIDYSLIIIKRSAEKNNYQIKTNEILSSDKEIIYNFGIIDYLESWTLKRKAERMFKSIITNQKVTADTPINYSNRLNSFIELIF